MCNLLLRVCVRSQLCARWIMLVPCIISPRKDIYIYRERIIYIYIHIERNETERERQRDIEYLRSRDINHYFLQVASETLTWVQFCKRI